MNAIACVVVKQVLDDRGWVYKVFRPDGTVSADRVDHKGDAMRLAEELARKYGCEVKDFTYTW